MRELLGILALSAALPSVGVAPTAAAPAVSMSLEAVASGGFRGPALILAKGGGMGGTARPQGGMNGGGGGMNCGANCRGGGMGGSGGGMGGGGGAAGNGVGPGGGAGGLHPLFDSPQADCPEYRRNRKRVKCSDDW
jgi:hypothetical protein